jgi:hypothetical protein
MKPIEPGCLAIITGNDRCPEDVGKLVVVLWQTFVGSVLRNSLHVVATEGDYLPVNKLWEVESLGAPLLAAFAGGFRRYVPTAVYQEHHLRRIDDAQGDDETLEWAGRPPAEAELFREAFVKVGHRRSSDENPFW